jgi:hypothetical protein
MEGLLLVAEVLFVWALAFVSRCIGRYLDMAVDGKPLGNLVEAYFRSNSAVYVICVLCLIIIYVWDVLRSRRRQKPSSYAQASAAVLLLFGAVYITAIGVAYINMHISVIK